MQLLLCCSCWNRFLPHIFYVILIYTLTTPLLPVMVDATVGVALYVLLSLMSVIRLSAVRSMCICSATCALVCGDLYLSLYLSLPECQTQIEINCSFFLRGGEFNGPPG